MGGQIGFYKPPSDVYLSFLLSMMEQRLPL